MSTTALDRLKLRDAYLDYVRSISAVTEAILDGRDSVEYASKVSALSTKLSLSSHELYEQLSRSHAENLGIDPDEELPGTFGGMIRPNSPSENPDDFAGWAHDLAVDRSYGPITPLSPWTTDPNAEHRLSPRQLLPVGYQQAAE